MTNTQQQKKLINSDLNTTANTQQQIRWQSTFPQSLSDCNSWLKAGQEQEKRLAPPPTCICATCVSCQRAAPTAAQMLCSLAAGGALWIPQSQFTVPSFSGWNVFTLLPDSGQINHTITKSCTVQPELSRNSDGTWGCLWLAVTAKKLVLAWTYRAF